MDDVIKVMLSFSADTKHGVYNDNLYFTQDEFAKISPDDLAAMKQHRVDNWVYQIENPPVAVELTKEDLQAELAEIVQQKAELEIAIAAKG